MDESRIYRCLICSDVITGKIRASMHVAGCHSDELEDRHFAEFLVIVGVEEVEVGEMENTRVPPFMCRQCEHGRNNEKAIRDHVAAAHDLIESLLVYGEHYISRIDLIAEEAQEEREFQSRLDLTIAAIHSWNNVGDFLTDTTEGVWEEDA